MKNKIICFGEIMMRLSPKNYSRIAQVNELDVYYGGAEANVAVSLAQLNNPVSYITILPNNQLGDAAQNSLRKLGVDTSHIIRKEGRLGINFTEIGASLRASDVIYDRKFSIISQIQPDEIKWEKLFRDAIWFHITGITPALSDNLAEECIKAIQIAKKLNLTISCDLNYRNKLWSREKAKKIMSEIVQHVDLLISNEEDAFNVFDISMKESNIERDQIDIDNYKDIAFKLSEISNAKYIAITLRESLSASDNNWSALLFSNGEYYISKKYSLHIIDRIGSGDVFGAGLIHGIINEFDLQDSLEFAVAASALKQTIPGDFNYINEDEVERIVGGNISGRVQR